MKKYLINELRNTLWDYYNQDGYYPFYNFLDFHYKYGKYTMMSLCIDEKTDELMIECVGYSSFGHHYFHLNELSTNTIKMIKERVELNLVSACV